MNINQDDDIRRWSSEEDIPDLHPMLASNGFKPEISNKLEPLPPHTMELVANVSRKNSQKRQ